MMHPRQHAVRSAPPPPPKKTFPHATSLALPNPGPTEDSPECCPCVPWGCRAGGASHGGLGVSPVPDPHHQHSTARARRLGCHQADPRPNLARSSTSSHTAVQKFVASWQQQPLALKGKINGAPLPRHRLRFSRLPRTQAESLGVVGPGRTARTRLDSVTGSQPARLWIAPHANLPP